jgi:hypothetical protein
MRRVVGSGFIIAVIAAAPAFADAPPPRAMLLEQLKHDAEIYGEIAAIWTRCSKKPPPVNKTELLENRRLWSDAEVTLIARSYDAGGERGRLVACGVARARAEKLIDALERPPDARSARRAG